MHTVILLILLATIVLFACKKEKEPTRYCTTYCSDSNPTIELRAYNSASETDSIRLRIFEAGTNFTNPQKDSMIYDVEGYIVYERANKQHDYEVTIISTGDTFRLSAITYRQDSVQQICYRGMSPCMNELTSISMTVNGVPTPARYSGTGFAMHSIYLYKP